jgi:PAS domain S-box-containing protein
MKMPKSALVVDKDFFFVEFLGDLLEKRGYRVTKANDGKEAVSRLGQDRFDLLFMDMILPKIDGPQVIEFARMKYPDPRLPIIILSGAVIEQMDEIGDLNADYYVAKGPTGDVGDHIESLLAKIEDEPLPSSANRVVLESGKLYPRKATVDLMDMLTFQKAVIESVGIGIVVVDRDARIIGANSLASEMVGSTSVELLNLPVTDIFPHEAKSKLVSALKRVINNRGLRKFTFPAVIGSTMVQVSVSVLQARGEISGWTLALVESVQ